MLIAQPRARRAVKLSLPGEHGGGWVHALARFGSAEPRFEVSELGPHARASAAGRELCCRMAAATLGVPGSELSIERRPSAAAYDGFEPPRLCDKRVPTGLDVSLSHDGRFVAAALAAAAGRREYLRTAETGA